MRGVGGVTGNPQKAKHIKQTVATQAGDSAADKQWDPQLTNPDTVKGVLARSKEDYRREPVNRRVRSKGVDYIHRGLQPST